MARQPSIQSSAAEKGTPLLCRERELAQLCRALDDALDGRGGVVLVVGEAGIGKTRLAQELASVSSTRGASVLWGRSSDFEGSPPFWLWTQVLGSLPSLAGAGDQIALIVPQLNARLPERGRQSPANDQSARFRLAEAVHKLLARACERVPLILVLEDLHWADTASLFLLESLAQRASSHRMLILATCREEERTGPVAHTLAELSRLGVSRIALSGLPLHGTTKLMAAVSGGRPKRELARAVHARTAGNPFFVSEIAHGSALTPLAIPEGVRTAISSRLTRMSRATRELLAAAAVIGRTFDLPLLSAVLPATGEETLLRSLDEGLQAMLIEPLGDGGGDVYQFRHALIQEALYGSMSPGRRCRWHARIVRALERTAGGRVETRTAELAQHAVRAGVFIEPAAVAKYSRLAGEHLLAAHAFDEARQYFERAWRAREGLPLDGEGTAILAGLACAQAATTERWNRQEGWRTLRTAIEHDLSTGNIDRAVSLATHPSMTAEGTTGVAEVVERIRRHVARGSLQEGWLLARLGAATYFERGDYRAAQAALGRALGISAAERSPALELRTLASFASVDHFELRWPEVLARSRRICELALRADDLYSETYARYRAAYALMQTGSADKAAVEADATVAAAERLKDHGLLADALYVTSALAQLNGDWRRARTHSDRGLALAPRHLALLHARAVLEYETGHAAAGKRYLRRLRAADGPESPYPLAGVFVAMALAQTSPLGGDPAWLDEAGRAARAVLRRTPGIPNAVATARITRALATIRRSHSAECATDLEFLSAFNGTILAPGLVTDRLLGRLADAAGQKRRAAARFEATLAFCRRSGYQPELAWTCFDYARALLADRGQRLRAAALLEEALHVETALGMPPLAGAVRTFRRRYGIRLERKPAGLTGRELEILALLSKGRTNKEIANALGISTNTVAVHVARVLRKTGASNRTGAVAYAVGQRLLDSTLP